MYSIVTLREIFTNSEVNLLEGLYGNLPEDSFSDVIYKLRKMHGLSREVFAERVNRHASTIKEWEDGVKTPTRTSIEKVCTVFGLDIGTFGNFEIKKKVG